MIHGNKNLIFLIVLILFFSSKIYSEEKISSSPLINIDKIKPSFDEVEEKNENLSVNRKSVSYTPLTLPTKAEV